jgi:glycosyltransferase involved in cell wall biosynthesis
MTRTRVRLCLLCEDLSLPIDEGIKKFVTSVSGPLAEMADLLVLAAGDAGPLPAFVQAAPANRFLLGGTLGPTLRRFQPDIVVYVPIAAATRNSFVRCAILRGYAPRARLLMVSLQPRTYGPLARRLIWRLGPDLTLVQSLATCHSLTRLGCPAAVLPSGVDLHAFAPVSRREKGALRARYGLPPEAYVVLHVGHLKRQRNVLLLNRVRSELSCETVVVGSTSTPSGVDHDVATALRAGGTHVIDRYIERIAELYQLADCYLFPVHATGGAIEAPLSVLEAMACDLPVVSTRFGFLRQSFADGPGVTFADSDEGLLAAVRRLRETREQRAPGQVRAQVQPFSWDAIARTLLAHATGVRQQASGDRRQAAVLSPDLSPTASATGPCGPSYSAASGRLPPDGRP